MKRFGQLIGIKPERLAVYKQLHAAVWPAVLKKIEDCNIRNYSIYNYDDLLFAYFEYHGDDFEGDMAKMAADPMTQEWWAICVPMQTPVEKRKPGEHWHTMEEVFHC
jgi:L-rhamnose mutarotase